MSIRFEPHNDYPEKILIREFHDEVNVSEIIKSWNELIKEDLINGNLKGVINDINNCTLNMNMESFEELLIYLKDNKLLHQLKLAVLCDSPNKIVFPIIGDKKVKEIKIKPFTTIEAASQWILE